MDGVLPYLIWGKPNAKNQQLLGDQRLEDEDHEVHDDGIPSISEPCEAVCQQSTADGVHDDWRGAYNKNDSER